MTILRDSSASLTFSFSLLAAALEAAESQALEKRLACLAEEEYEESLRLTRELTVESHLEAWSFIPCITLIPDWYNILLMYLKLMPKNSHTPNPSS